MRSNNYKSVLKHAGLAASVLLLASGAAVAQQQVNSPRGWPRQPLAVGPCPCGLQLRCDQVAGSTANVHGAQ